MQAVILAGGEGTRLRPLTLNRPKPVIKLVDRPFIVYMLEWLKSHGVDDVVMSCGFLADGVREVLGDGSQFGIKLNYVEEPEPMGTAGAVKYAEHLLQERFLVLNGDVMTDIDLSSQIKQHLESGATATLALCVVEDPSAYGLVPIDGQRRVEAFLEKSSDPNPPTDLINAGAYVLERSVLEMMQPGVNTSFEREIFPRLVGNGLYGYPTECYWLDIGTPDRYLQATADILSGAVKTEVADLLGEGGVLAKTVLDGSDVDVSAPALIGKNLKVGSGTKLRNVVIGDDVTIGSGCLISDSVVFDGVKIGDGCRLQSVVVDSAAEVGSRTDLSENTMVGSDAKIGSDNVIAAGARVFPGCSISDGAIKF